MLAGLRRASGLEIWLAWMLGWLPATLTITLTLTLTLTLAMSASIASAEPVPAPQIGAPFRLDVEEGNDQLYGSNGDDQGFTQDFTLRAHYIAGRDDYSLGARQRLMLERGGQRRTDEVTFELRWLTEHALGPFEWTFGPSLALALSGNYGGAKLQSAWHELLDNGYTLEEGLPNDYAPHRTGVVFGGRGGPSWLPLPWLRLLVGAELAGALGGTGQSLIAVYDALEFEAGKPGFRLVLGGGIDFERSWTQDPTLRLSGGYDTSGIYRSTHLRMAARGQNWEAGFRARTNVGGSEGNSGMIYVLCGGGEGFRHEHALR